MLWGAVPACPETSAPWHPLRLGRTRTPIRSNSRETGAQKPKHTQAVTAPRIMAQLNSHTFPQEQLELSFQILFFSQRLDCDSATEKTISFSVRFGNFFLYLLLNMSQTNFFLFFLEKSKVF